MSRRCRRIRAMKILVESVETGSAHIQWGSNRSKGFSPPIQARWSQATPASPRSSSMQTTSSAERLRSRSSALPVKVFPGKVSASQPNLSPFIAPRPVHACTELVGAVNRSKGRIELDSGGACRRPPNSIGPLHSLRGLRFHTTKYRTTLFGNLSRLWKYRVYQIYKKKQANWGFACTSKCALPHDFADCRDCRRISCWNGSPERRVDVT